MSGRITWLGGSHAFGFQIGELRALQDETNSGPGEVLSRLNAGSWRVDDITSTLRLGLIGGGASEDEASAAVTRVTSGSHVNWFTLALTASTVLSSGLFGNPDAPPEKPKGESLEDGISEPSTDGAA
ncbi:hypothetical protein RSK20926_11799 [Roseobacter sp. SK209-2-6]|uniref:gene transfer agent family protein n=1 Tax=Roseobacter sp. SK209-2-6 TaxID=388739 RepID=UPI0000F3C51F|nr:gene transfer agent family protein [Roseobacter sp. SK209-2-6]EBA18401.1 hypothetical protein RSK20926_11799 [Roseobacter sp. SK209-2-6]